MNTHPEEHTSLKLESPIFIQKQQQSFFEVALWIFCLVWFVLFLDVMESETSTFILYHNSFCLMVQESRVEILPAMEIF